MIHKTVETNHTNYFLRVRVSGCQTEKSASVYGGVKQRNNSETTAER